MADRDSIKISQTGLKERKRRKREMWLALFFVCLIGALTWVQLKYLGVNYLFMIIFNVNLILLLLVLFIVGRNGVKLLLERPPQGPGVAAADPAGGHLHPPLPDPHSAHVPGGHQVRAGLHGLLVQEPGGGLHGTGPGAGAVLLRIGPGGAGAPGNPCGEIHPRPWNFHGAGSEWTVFWRSSSRNTT